MATSPFNILSHEAMTEELPVDAAKMVYGSASNELVFAVVGHVGSGTSLIAEALKEALEDGGLRGGSYETHIIKARSVLIHWAAENDFCLLKPEDKSMEATELLQDCGDAMRKKTEGRVNTTMPPSRRA